jgi:anti-sigma B factor antagonist
MSQDGFAVRASQRGETAVLHLSGTVTKAAQEDLEAAFREASADSARLLLDFGAVEYINSTGIAVIVGLLAMARAEGIEVGAYGLSNHYREVFQITRLSDFMTMYDDESAATLAAT